MHTPNQTNALLVQRMDLVVKQGQTLEIFLPLVVGKSYTVQRTTAIPGVDPAPTQTRLTLSQALETPLTAGTLVLLGDHITAEVAADAALYSTEVFVLTDLTAVVKSGTELSLYGDYGEAVVRAQIRRLDGGLIVQLKAEKISAQLYKLSLDAMEALKLPATLSVAGQEVGTSKLYWEVDLIYPPLIPVEEGGVPYVQTPAGGEVHVITQHSYEGYIAEYPQYAFPNYPAALPERANTQNPYTAPLNYNSMLYQLYGIPVPRTLP